MDGETTNFKGTEGLTVCPDMSSSSAHPSPLTNLNKEYIKTGIAYTKFQKIYPPEQSQSLGNPTLVSIELARVLPLRLYLYVSLLSVSLALERASTKRQLTHTSDYWITTVRHGQNFAQPHCTARL